jgi:hypothetical protein
MQVIEALRASILVPHDHLHINHVGKFVGTASSSFGADSRRCPGSAHLSRVMGRYAASPVIGRH